VRERDVARSLGFADEATRSSQTRVPWRAPHASSHANLRSDAGPAQRSTRAIRDADFIVCALTSAALILELSIQSAVLVWPAVRANRFARELLVAV
jgi:hypothetical protein